MKETIQQGYYVSLSIITAALDERATQLVISLPDTHHSQFLFPFE